MAPTKNNDFDSLFNDEPAGGPQPPAEAFTFDEPTPGARADAAPPRVDNTPRRRTSDDFAPDMDALLITAQSSMIIEGMKLITKKDFSSKTLQIYGEAVKGIDLYIKILQRSPGNYQKLTGIINNDLDCKEVENFAFKIYRARFNDTPDTDDQKLTAFEEFRIRLKQAHDKAVLSASMQSVKKYYLMSGTLDQDQVSALAMSANVSLKGDVARLHEHIKIAAALVKSGDHEIAPGLKGRDVNTFLIRATQLMAYYYLIAKNADAEAYYRRLHENYKKYFVIG